ncbi:amidohydrolase family protein [Pseudomaricurvus sp. HS19]|uniref:amidohydrolase family protein n=1 Tax=Pseudomaricurvus sp. HS19 TaxID=2692626 RepID=UPI001370B2BE|nr:amidohydrolase family protein [Pseudomaricurvus sp. HS19]MYM64300.1 amidohydrolase family protein [Pseudomaricurvus sp. HS19]
MRNSWFSGLNVLSPQRLSLLRQTAVIAAAAALAGCAMGPGGKSASDRSLASYMQPPEKQVCYDRSKEPYTPVVDAHFHPRPFGGPAIPPQELFGYFDKLGVRFVNYFGIGQVLELQSGCTYYLDCPGVSAKPSIKNDFVNGMDVKAYQHDNLYVILSMTFIDLAHPENAARMIELYDTEFPGMFRWAGELNVMKQALVENLHEPATLASIDAWAPFMTVLRQRNIPVTLHADLGHDANPTEFLYLMEHVLETYPHNKIVWAHAGLSKELVKMSPDQHVVIMSRLLDQYPNLMLDISWDVLYNAYHQWGDIYLPLLNKYSERILPGSDFVAAGSKDYAQYAHELEVTSRALRSLNDEAFRNIALGENYFRLLNLNYNAPLVCEPQVAN